MLHLSPPPPSPLPQTHTHTHTQVEELSTQLAATQRNYESMSRMMQVKQQEIDKVRRRRRRGVRVWHDAGQAAGDLQGEETEEEGCEGVT